MIERLLQRTTHLPKTEHKLHLPLQHGWHTQLAPLPLLAMISRKNEINTKSIQTTH